MPLFTGRVGAPSYHYQVPRAAYFDPSTTDAPPRELVLLDATALSTLKLPYDPKAPHKECTLWQYACKSLSGIVVASLTNVKKKVGDAVDKAVREDADFWTMLKVTGDKVIIFEDPHWFWGRCRPDQQGQYWTGRNEMGELLMLVRESYRNSLARLMPLEPFPLFDYGAPPEDDLQSSRTLPAPVPRGLLSGRPPSSGKALSTMDRIPSAPFSRLVSPASSIDDGQIASFSPLYDRQPGVLSPRSNSSPFLHNHTPFPRSLTPLAPLPPLLSLDPPVLPGHRSSCSSISSTRSPPPPYSSDPGSPAPSFDFGPRFDVNVSLAGAHNQGWQTLPHRLRAMPVSEDMERRQLDRLREEFHAQQRNRYLSDNVAALRALSERRHERQEVARASRHLRELERAHLNSAALASRPRDTVGARNIEEAKALQALKNADLLGAKRRDEIEARLVAHRRAMRSMQEKRRNMELVEIERLAAGKRVRFDLDVGADLPRDRRYTMPMM